MGAGQTALGKNKSARGLGSEKVGPGGGNNDAIGTIYADGWGYHGCCAIFVRLVEEYERGGWRCVAFMDC